MILLQLTLMKHQENGKKINNQLVRECIDILSLATETGADREKGKNGEKYHNLIHPIIILTFIGGSVKMFFDIFTRPITTGIIT
tara:strand:- start:25 stop:276 length:252 start_codon:yes stop_codon:yes gene_type:complete